MTEVQQNCGFGVRNAAIQVWLEVLEIGYHDHLSYFALAKHMFELTAEVAKCQLPR